MLISRNLHKKGSEVSIKTRSLPASLSLKGQATKHTTVKWSILLFIRIVEMEIAYLWKYLLELCGVTHVQDQSNREITLDIQNVKLLPNFFFFAFFLIRT